MENLWEIPFFLLFLIVLSIWFTADYYVSYENMKNENKKSFSITEEILRIILTQVSY